MLLSVGWCLFTDIPEDGTDKFSRNVGNHQSRLRNTLEERGSNLHRGESLKLRIFAWSSELKWREVWISLVYKT